MKNTLLNQRRIARRTRGRKHGPITRLMSPSDFGALLKPFVFLDLFDHEGPPFNGGLHPHSGIATLTYVAEGSINYIAPDNATGVLPAGGVEWMQAGRGMWHGGGIGEGRTRGFQLWIALPPELELGPTLSLYQPPEEVQIDGPARVLLGSHGSASSVIESPSPINYLAVRLKAGERWSYEPPAGHTVLWGPPSHQAPCQFRTSCGKAIWRRSRHRTKRSNSRRCPMQNSCSARPFRIPTNSCSAVTRYTQALTPCGRARPKSRRSVIGWYRNTGFELTFF